MATIAVSDDGFAKVQLLARAWDVTEDEVVTRLLDDMAALTVSGGDEPEDVPVYAVYQGTRVEAVYNVLTEWTTVTTGTLAGTGFRSPSGAASAVVKALNPDISPNRNGWYFWTTESGRSLSMLRRRPPVPR